MRIIPVLDLRHGLAVHAAGGDRAHYRPLSSVWHPGSADPRDLAEAYKRKYQFDTPLELYLADLDAITRASPPDLRLYADLAAVGLRLWVDAGASSGSDPGPWLAAGAEVAILGLETLAGPDALSEAVDRWGPGRLLFSLDLRAGRPLSTLSAWGTVDPLEIASLAWDLGVTRLLLLDLARVGSGSGPWADGLLGSLSRRVPVGGELFVGGGVRDRADLESLRQMGASGAMVGTALHQGRVEPHDLNDWLPEPPPG
jgi:phosphoribosylformimino-5-aminoimidazole carboxamide ribotide isomerase